jgi:thioredoxin reductase (NADPH)
MEPVSGPLLLAVHGERSTLDSIERELRQRYSDSYRIRCTESATEAVQILRGDADNGGDVALVLAMLGLPKTGHVLREARQAHPHAKRGLLVPGGAFDDPPTAEEILEARAVGLIDYYVSTPGPPPDEVFHEAITSFLLEWSTENMTVPHTVHIIGESWSGRAYELREILGSCAFPHTFSLADSEQGRELLADVDVETQGDGQMPLMVLPSGRVLFNPSNAEIARIAGAPTDLAAHRFDVVVVGAGPAGLSAAVYGASEGLRTLVIDEGGVGGQARSSSAIRNYLGFPKGISGSRLAQEAYEQASILGASFLLMHEVTGLTADGDRVELTITDGQTVSADAVVLACGASYRRLGVRALEALSGAGVYYGGTASEAHSLAGRIAYVVGGGNSAGQAALHLSRYARRVGLVVRAASLEAGMSQYLIRELEETPNVDLLTSTTVVGGGGDGRLERLVLRRGETGEEETVAADGLFVLIGARPRIDWLPDTMASGEGGFLLTGPELCADDWPLERRPLSLETSIPGVLAAGDVRRASIKRVASAVGEGSIAIRLVHCLLEGSAAGTAVPAVDA